MILAAGLSPAWQQIILLTGLRIGEVNRARSVSWCASGKVLNVARALQTLGAEVMTLAPIGGAHGEAIRADFEQNQIPAHWINTQFPSRVCTTLLAPGETTELVENMPSMTHAELAEFAEAFRRLGKQAELIIFSGSLPSRIPDEFLPSILEGFGPQLILDIRGKDLLHSLSIKPWLVKPNREEFQATFREGEISHQLIECHSRGAERILLTKGASPILVSSQNEGIREIPTLCVDALNPIGCGDCLAAGIGLATVRGKPFEEAILYGIAAATDNLTALETANLNPARVDQYYRSLQRASS